jgi:hypothetical protein
MLTPAGRPPSIFAIPERLCDAPKSKDTMPTDVKAIVSVVTLLAALAFAWWEASVARAVPAWFIIGFAVFALWIFPEAGVKKGDLPPKERR